jgi:hypothetical protein
MAFELIRPGHQQPIVAGSPILPRQAVQLGGTSGLLAFPAASMNVRPFGVNGGATAGVASGAALPGETFTVYEELNVVKAKAGASLGAGAEVAVGSDNGTFWPVAAASLFAASGHWTVGIAETPAGVGEVFSLYVKPRKV